MATKIFVGSLPSGCKPEELRHLFETFGVVTECDVMNRCGFVHMENADMAETAIKALNSTEFKGETINVEPGRIRGERNQKAGGKIGAAGLVRNRNRGRMGQDGPGPQGMEFDGIDENVTKDALQICSAVFEEMNKMLNPNMHQGAPRRGGGGNMPMALPKNFASQLELLSSGGVMDGGNRTNNRNRQRNNRNNSAGANQGSVGRVVGQGGNPVVQKLGNAVRVPNQGNVARVPNQAKVVGVPNNANVRGQHQGNAVRAQNQGNAKVQNQGKPKIAPNQDNVIVQGATRANTGRSQVQGNPGRAPKQGNVGPIRNDPVRPRNNAVPYNRGGNSRGNSAGPQAANINFADDIPIAQNARTFANNLASGSQIDNRWQSNNGNFGGNGGAMNSLMGRNFDEDIPVTNFNNDAPMNNGMGSGNSSNFNRRGSGGMGNQGSLTNHGNFGQSLGNGGGNDRYQNSGSNNDRFQSGGNYGMGNQDRRGFALPERQNFNDNQKFGNQDFRRDNSQQGGLNNQSNLGGSNRDFGFGNNSGRQESRNLGGNMGGNDNTMFTRRNNNAGNLDGNNMGNSRMRNNDLSDNNNFGGNNNRGGGVGNTTSSSGFNRNMGGGSGGNNRNMGGGSGGINRNMGGGSGGNNSNMGGGMNGNRSMGGGGNNNNRNNMSGGTSHNNNRNNMGAGGGNSNNNRNNMGGGGGGSNNSNRNNMGNGGGGNNNSNRNNMPGSLINPLNFQKDFPALSIGSNMNDRNGPRQNNNMMSNRRW